jgi:hypothetical protein
LKLDGAGAVLSRDGPAHAVKTPNIAKPAIASDSHVRFKLQEI